MNEGYQGIGYNAQPGTPPAQAELAPEEFTRAEFLELQRMVAENNSILRGMRRKARLHTVMRMIMIVAVVAGLLYAYAAIRPYLDKINSVYSDVTHFTDKVSQVGQSVQPTNINKSIQSFFGIGQ